MRSLLTISVLLFALQVAAQDAGLTADSPARMTPADSLWIVSPSDGASAGRDTVETDVPPAHPRHRLAAEFQKQSTAPETRQPAAQADRKTLTREQKRMRRDSIRLNWKPDPSKATWMAVIVPGLGQIYNRKYWKLPIIYGGFMGCAYAISWNGSMYHDYKRAYRDIIDDDPATTSYLDILPQGYTVDMMGGMTAYSATLKSRQQRYHRYRDIGIVATVAVYALSIIDAFVDAQLYDFDISPDLSMSVAPALMEEHYCLNQRSAGLQFTLKF